MFRHKPRRRSGLRVKRHPSPLYKYKGRIHLFLPFFSIIDQPSDLTLLHKRPSNSSVNSLFSSNSILHSVSPSNSPSSNQFLLFHSTRIPAPSNNLHTIFTRYPIQVFVDHHQQLQKCLLANIHRARPAVQSPLTIMLPETSPHQKVIYALYLPTSSFSTPQTFSADQLDGFSANHVSRNRESLQAFRLKPQVLIASRVVKTESCH